MMNSNQSATHRHPTGAAPSPRNNEGPVESSGHSQRKKKQRKFPTTRREWSRLSQKFLLHTFQCGFYVADKAMYFLGPVLIALALAIMAGLTHVYFGTVLPMLSGTNWVLTATDYDLYRRQSTPQLASLLASLLNYLPRSLLSNTMPISDAMTEQQWKTHFQNSYQDNQLLPQWKVTLIALSTPSGAVHTLLVFFFLLNISYNYHRCVTTPNDGDAYQAVVRDLARATNFHYPETQEERRRCKADLEKNILDKIANRRRQLQLSQSLPQSGQSLQSSQTLHPGQSLQPPKVNSNDRGSGRGGSAVTQPPMRHWQLLSPHEWSFCRHSHQPKPPRSHYDHVTHALVLNMDHYCPWMFNAVGYFNYRYFVNFLCFVSLALFYGTCITIVPFWNLSGRKYREQIQRSRNIIRQDAIRLDPFDFSSVRHFPKYPFVPTPDERSRIAFGFMLCLSVGIAVMCLTLFHAYLMLSAQTTIEFHGNWSKRRRIAKERKEARKAGGNTIVPPPWKNPYSVGWRKNWEMVYGTRNYFPSTINSKDGGAPCRYRGCLRVFLAMMPSSRPPEFLPIPIHGSLVRRTVSELERSEVDLEMVNDETMGDTKESSSEGFSDGGNALRENIV